MPTNSGQTADEVQVPSEVAAMTLTMSSEVMVREVWFNVQSGRVYRVISASGEGARRTIAFCRVGTTNMFQLSIVRFAAKYRLAERSEMAAMLANVRPEEDEEESAPVGYVVEPDIRHDLARIIITDPTRMAIRVGMNKVVRREQIERVFHLSQIEPRGRRSVLNFWGPPGTGKTLCAVAIARALGKPLFQVDYSEIISKWMGDTAKHIKRAFDEARRLDAVLFFDEADALLSKRADMDGGTPKAWAASMNQNRNVLMQELDRFDGVVVMATNKFRNFDEAFVRRIAQHVQFVLPDATMRVALFKLHLPCTDRLDNVDWDALAAASDGLSGGDILNVSVNTISRVSLADDEAQWRISQRDLLAEIAQIKAAKEEAKEKPAASSRGRRVEHVMN